MRPDVNFNVLDELTPKAVEAGHRLFTSHMTGGSDAAHVRNLVYRMDVPQNGTVVDMGCGIGEFERLATYYRPDIRWFMVNLSSVQLSMCPKGPQFYHVYADAHDTHMPADTFDRVLFHTALVQMDYRLALEEAYRILKPGGKVFLWEMVRLRGDNIEWMQKLDGFVPSEDALLRAAESAGLVVRDSLVGPRARTDRFRQLLGADAYLLDTVAIRAITLLKPQTNNGG